jgi:integrase
VAFLFRGIAAFKSTTTSATDFKANKKYLQFMLQVIVVIGTPGPIRTADTSLQMVSLRHFTAFNYSQNNNRNILTILHFNRILPSWYFTVFNSKPTIKRLHKRLHGFRVTSHKGGDMKFTDTIIRNLKQEPKMYQQREGKGFGIRVLPSGHKIWIFIYTYDGKRRQMNLGSYPELSLADARAAYSAAYAILHDKQNPRDPQEERDQKHEAERNKREERRLEPTVNVLIKEFLEKWVAKKRNIRAQYDDKRSLGKDIVPRWGDLKANDIRRRDAILMLEEVAARAPGQARSLSRLCRKMFSFGIQREIVDSNPFIEMASTIPELAPVRRSRTLNATEISAIWQGIGDGPGSEPAKNILKLILVTGQRPSEICGMRESEINGSWWSIPAERMKNRKPHRVYLTQLALSLIPETDNDIIFPSGRTGRPIDVGTLSYILKRANYYDVPHWTPHDGRRTCRTFMAEIGVPREHAEAVLSHSLQGVEGTYNRHHYDKEKQTALESWARKLNGIITDKKIDNVTSINEGKRKAA